MGEGDHAAKEEAMKRLSEPEGDHELHSVLERMRVHHPAAPVEEERVREIVSTHSYAIEYVAV